MTSKEAQPISKNRFFGISFPAAFVRRSPNILVRYADLWIAGAILIAAIAVISLDWQYGLKGGSSTVGAERVLNGQIPYRDFWTIYAPGSFYLLALLFKIFGLHLMVEVVAATVICALAAALCYLLAVNLLKNRTIALIGAAVFVAVLYNTTFYDRLDTYPPTITLILLTLNLLVLHLRTEKWRYLIAAGLTNGLTAIFKHDVGGYTAIAIIVGLAVYFLLAQEPLGERLKSWFFKAGAYGLSALSMVLPVAIYFTLQTGADMLQDIIIFPLTDFRYARPENYPSLIPANILDASRLQTLYNLFNYFQFAIPFALFILGVAALILAVRARERLFAGMAATLVVGFLFHYYAAHVQINTHIITMSVYSVLLTGLFLKLAGKAFSHAKRNAWSVVGLLLAAGWLAALLAKPAYLLWYERGALTSRLDIPKVSGFMVTPAEANELAELSDYVNANTRPNEKIFIGLHRHDIVIISDTLAYFTLDRPNATRYHELHPGIADTAKVQQEIISDLVENQTSLVILKYIFSNEALDKAKAIHGQHLKTIGATDLDDFIHTHYSEVKDIGPYMVWHLDFAAGGN
jgi:hypothetical protein